MFFHAFLQALDPTIIGFLFLGSISGLLVGALPGLSVTMATAILVSITYSWQVENAFAMILGVYCSGVFAGSLSAILLNIPGAPAAVVTGFDGYPLAKLGQAASAMGFARIGSFIGGLIGVLFLAVFAPLLTKVALSFSPFEYVALVVLGLISVSNMGKGRAFLKAMLTALIGFVISCVGLDPIYGIGRFTFGSEFLQSGLGLVPCLIGFFGMSEVISQFRQIGQRSEIAQVTENVRLFPDLDKVRKTIPLILRSSVIGAWIGALPGEGGAIAALLAYDAAKRSVKNPSRPFGEGAYEGVIAPESSNNAAIGGALTTMLTLGVPGDAVTAVMIGAFMIHGLRPGPMMMEERPDLFWLIVVLLLLANVIFLFVGLIASRYFPKIVASIQKEVLMPIVTVFCVVGAYSLNSSIDDVLLMLAMGVIGYLFKCSDYPIAPLIIGMVLGPIGDSEFRRASMMANSGFLVDLFQHPIALVLLAFAAYQVLDQFTRVKKLKRDAWSGIKSLFSGHNPSPH